MARNDSVFKWSAKTAIVSRFVTWSGDRIHDPIAGAPLLKTDYEPHGDPASRPGGIKELISCVVKVTASQDIG